MTNITPKVNLHVRSDAFTEERIKQLINVMEHIKIIPSINDNTDDLHKPSVIARFVWRYGYIDAFDMPIARRNKITGMVEVRRYNEIFGYWAWMEVNDKYKTEFVAKKYMKSNNKRAITSGGLINIGFVFTGKRWLQEGQGWKSVYKRSVDEITYDGIDWLLNGEKVQFFEEL